MAGNGKELVTRSVLINGVRRHNHLEAAIGARSLGPAILVGGNRDVAGLDVPGRADDRGRRRRLVGEGQGDRRLATGSPKRDGPGLAARDRDLIRSHVQLGGDQQTLTRILRRPYGVSTHRRW